MSAKGQKQTFAGRKGMPAYRAKADMCGALARGKLAYAVSSKCFGLITSLLKFSEKVGEPRGD